MPYSWVRVPTSPPRARRDDDSNICRKHGGRLCERQIFYDDVEGSAFALIEWPNREEAAQALLSELGAFDHVSLVDADEQAERNEEAGT
jgi:hypothetical protein